MNRKPIINPDPTKEIWEWKDGSCTVISTMTDLAVYKALLYCYITVHNRSKYFYIAEQRAKNSTNVEQEQYHRECMKEHVETAEFFYEKLLALKQHCKDMGYRFPHNFQETKDMLNAKERRYHSFKKRE
jgi:hypothetical protein